MDACDSQPPFVKCSLLGQSALATGAVELVSALKEPVMRPVLLTCCGLVVSICSAVADEPPAKFAFIDLQPQTNQELRATFSADVPDCHLAELPQGEQKLGAATYKIGPGCIKLGGKLGPDLPAKAEIPVKRKFTKLHVLHATQNGGFADEAHPTHIKDGTLIGEYTIRYSDGSTETIPIVYGEDVRDWWNWDKSKETKRGKVVWTGTNPAVKMYEIDARLYELIWTNPKPDLEVASIVFSSKMDTPGAPFCVALTTAGE
jgi:hypothetical protein